MPRTIPLLALAGLVTLSGCAGLGFGDRYDHRRADDVYYDDGYYGDRYDRYGSDAVYARRVERDAQRYANDLDRYLRISNREERAIRELLEYRTFELLDRTRVRDHARAYPFPRRRGHAKRFWARADRDIQRILDRRYHEPYAYYNRYGPERYTDYYRYRRYDDRRGWVDTRREDQRAARRAAENRRDRREDAREARRRAEQREEARRDRREEERRDARREARRDNREEARRDARREARNDNRREARRDARDDSRREARRDDRREQTGRDRDRRRENARTRGGTQRTSSEADRRRDRRAAPRRDRTDDRRAETEDERTKKAAERRRSRRGGSE